MNFVKHPLPADFLVQYLKLTRGELVALYKVSQSTVNRWSATMPDDAKAAHALIVKAARYGVDPHAFKRPRPMPDDFTVNFRRMTKAALVRHYVAGMATIIKWAATTSDDDKAAHKAHVAAVLVSSQALAIASAKANREARPKPDKPVKVSKRQAPGRGVTWGHAKAVPIPEAKADIVSMAMRALQRIYAPVYRAETVAGKAAVGLFKVGRMTMTEPELLALAARRGFAVSEGFAG